MKRSHGLLVTLLAAAALAAAAGAQDGSPPRRVLLEKDEAYARSASALRNSGMKILGDYGRLVLAEITGVRARKALDVTGVRVRRVLSEGVKLRRRVVTTGDGIGRPDGRNLFLVRPRGPARPSWVESLHGTPGVRVLAALPENAYLAWLPQGAASLLASLPERPEIATPLQPSDRISPDLDGAGDPVEANVYFVTTPGGRAAASAARDRSFGSPGVAPRLPGLTGEALTLSRDDLEEIASWKELVWAGPFQRPVVHDEVSSLLTAGRLDQGRPLGPHYRQWLSLHGLDDLSSWIVQVVDTGIDSGLAGGEHPALAGRLLFALDESGGDHRRGSPSGVRPGRRGRLPVRTGAGPHRPAGGLQDLHL
jgi:hypothetical protein